jgi:hypothetical protein
VRSQVQTASANRHGGPGPAGTLALERSTGIDEW